MEVIKPMTISLNQLGCQLEAGPCYATKPRKWMRRAMFGRDVYRY